MISVLKKKIVSYLYSIKYLIYNMIVYDRLNESVTPMILIRNQV